jgi:prophage antirepressor-like protein
MCFGPLAAQPAKLHIERRFFIGRNLLNDITLFSFENNNIRTISENGDVWFVGKDICDVLGYQRANDALAQHCRATVDYRSIPDALGRPQKTRVINEPDLYRLVIKSTLPAAERFEAWVMEEVLPTLRKTGTYTMPSTNDQSLITYKLALEVATLMGFTGNQALLSADNYVRASYGTSVVDRMIPSGLIAQRKELTFTPTELGKLNNPPLSAIKFNLMLAGAGLQTRSEYGYEPTDLGLQHCEVLDTQKRHSDGTAVKQIKWFKSVFDCFVE